MSDPMLINRDEEHLRLLTIFHFVCAGMAALFACLLGVFTIIVLARASVKSLFCGTVAPA